VGFVSRRLLIAALAALLFAVPAQAQGKVTLVPGVTYEAGVQFTTHGPVAFHVLTAPRPGGLYALRPTLARDAILGKESVTSMQKRLLPTATVAGVNGDLFNLTDGHPSGVVMRDGVLDHPPLGERSSVGVDETGTLHVDRVKFFGTWRGLGQRRTLNGLNETPEDGQVVLFTPVWGPTTPAIPGTVEVTIAPLPVSVPNTDLAGPVTAVTQNGGTPIPPGGAVLVARGAVVAPKLLAEAPVGTMLIARLIHQPEWTGIENAVGGGPVIVRDGNPVFRSFEGFTTQQLLPRNPRTAVGQLADGRIILLAVDGREAGYSVGLTNFELAQTMARLGAVSASALDAGGSTTMAFEGKLLNQPSDPTGERSVKESLNVLYYGVYTPPPVPDVLSPDGDGADEQVALAYKIVRPSSVTAQLLGPGGATITLEQPAPPDPVTGLPAPPKAPGTYSFTWDGVDPVTGQPAPEGRWAWKVTATDDQAQVSTQSRQFTFNTTLEGVAVEPGLLRLPPRGGKLSVTFGLKYGANVEVRVETPLGTIIRTLTRRGLRAGTQTIVWDGRLATRRKPLVHSGRYLAHVIVTNAFGKAELVKPFSVRRIAGPKPKRKPTPK
jgi:exopolysaccharide biosynthesis protein